MRYDPSVSALQPPPPQQQQQQKPRKPILYYSNHCQNCRIVIDAILKHDLRAMFACVCVDTKRELVPHFVSTVPTVFLVQERQLLKEKLLSEYIGRLISVKEKEFDSVVPMEGNSSMAEAFSWVDHDKMQHEDNHFSSRFVPVNYTQHFNSIEEDTTTVKNNNATDMEAAFETMRNQRAEDIANAAQVRR